MTSVAGVLPPLPTPFGPGGSLAPGRIERDVARLAAAGVSGFVALGSNGEAVHLSGEEASTLFAAVRRAAPASLPVVAGAGRTSTWETIEWCRRAGDAGCSAVLVAPPSYYRGGMTPDVLRSHYEAVADASPLPLLLYNVPANAVPVPVEVVSALAAHPNVAGVKDSSGDIGQLASLVGVKPRGKAFAVMAGNYGAFFPGLPLGIDGGILAVANVAPHECARILSLFGRGEIEAAAALHFQLFEVARLVTSRYGVPGLKAALDLLGAEGGEPRRPLLPLGDPGRAEISRALAAAGLLKT